MKLRVCVLAAVVLAGSLAGCAPMTPQQVEGVELRRYCETHPNETEKCLGFYGWL